MTLARKNQNYWLPSLFNDFFGNEWFPSLSAGTPAVNILESDKDYTVEIAAPGVTKNDFVVSLGNDNELNISLEKKTENKEGKKEGKYLRRDFSYTQFNQTMVLPDNVDKNKIEAEVKDGVLSIVIPKIGEDERKANQKVIEIK